MAYTIEITLTDAQFEELEELDKILPLSDLDKAVKKAIREWHDTQRKAKSMICPVCAGRGFVSSSFYQSVQSDTFVGGGGTETCRSCGGKGYIIEWESEGEDEKKEGCY